MWKLLDRVLTWVYGPVKFWVVNDGAARPSLSVVASRVHPAGCTLYSGLMGGHATRAFAQGAADAMTHTLERTEGRRPK